MKPASFYLVVPVIAAFAVLAAPRLSAQVINIDFLAQDLTNGNENSPSPNFVGLDPVGGGTVYNGISALYAGGTTGSETVAGTALLNDMGGITTTNFTITASGADHGSNGPSQLAPVNGGYVYDQAGHITTIATFTFSGLGTQTLENIFLTTSDFTQNDGSGIGLPVLTFNNGGGTPVTYTAIANSSSPFAAYNTFEFDNVNVSTALGGSITGTIAPNPNNAAGIVIISALTAEAIPEPSTYAMIFGGLGIVLLVSRFRGKQNA